VDRTTTAVELSTERQNVVLLDFLDDGNFGAGVFIRIFHLARPAARRISSETGL
jgi:hypothetical protein